MSHPIVTPAATLLMFVAGTSIACSNESPANRAATSTVQSAVTAVTPSQVPPAVGQISEDPYRGSDFGPAPRGEPVPEKIPRQPKVSAADLPAHFRNKIVDKPARPAPTTPPPAVPATYVAKQNEYIAKWKELLPTIANLPAEEQDARRAALKRSVLGQ